MELNAIHDTLEEIPEQFRGLYAERDGKWELSGIKGIRTDADVARVQTAADKERTSRKEFEAKAKIWGDMDHTQTVADLDELKEARIRLEANPDGKIDEENLTKLVDAKVATQVAPIKKELETALQSNQELTEKNTTYANKETTRTITDSVRLASVGSKVIDTAMEDIIMLSERVFEVQEDGRVTTRDEMGCTPGIDASTWLGEMQEKRPHWWPSSTGGGGKGSGNTGGFTDNPFSGGADWNLTKQGEAQRADPVKAARMATAAGTTVGGPRPIVKAAQQ